MHLRSHLAFSEQDTPPKTRHDSTESHARDLLTCVTRRTRTQCALRTLIVRHHSAMSGADTLSAYEQQRDLQIKLNQQVLIDLGILDECAHAHATTMLHAVPSC